MKCILGLAMILGFISAPFLKSAAQVAVPYQKLANYDEAKVGNYELPALLKMVSGKNVTSARQWEKERRPEILKLFKANVYGEFPGKAAGQHYRVNKINNSALGGKAVSKQITVFFTKDEQGPSMEVLIYLPKNVNGPVPVFAGYNFCGNQCVSSDAEIAITKRWVRTEPKNTTHVADSSSRGMQANEWDIEKIIDRKYGVVTAYYGDLEPDNPEGWKTGVRSQLQKQLSIEPSAWCAIGAWAWGLSRMMDYFETDAAINARQVVVIGHSRLGKTALWAGANDTRFAAVISNESGEGGAALARRHYGETISTITKQFPHWFINKYNTYADNENNMPVDQHMLLALIAPRPLYVASAEDDRWSDPKGEFLSALNAGPAYQLFNKTGLGVTEMPPVNYPVGATISYHVRTGKHDITDYDWQQYLNFADKQVMGK